MKGMSRRFLAVVGCVVVGLLFVSSVNATNSERVIVQVTFVDPLAISEDGGLQYGYFYQRSVNSETVVIVFY